MLDFRGPRSKRHGSMSGAIASLGVGKLADKLLEDGQNLKDCSTSNDIWWFVSYFGSIFLYSGWLRLGVVDFKEILSRWDENGRLRVRQLGTCRCPKLGTTVGFSLRNGLLDTAGCRRSLRFRSLNGLPPLITGCWLCYFSVIHPHRPEMKPMSQIWYIYIYNYICFFIKYTVHWSYFLSISLVQLIDVRYYIM